MTKAEQYILEKVNDYRDKVIRLFQSGEATDEMWEEMSACILDTSEGNYNYKVCHIDKRIVEDQIDNEEEGKK